MADREGVAGLVQKLRAKGLSDEEVAEGLQGMGFSKAEAQAAVGSRSTPKRTAPRKAASASPKSQGGRKAGGAPTGPTSTPPGPPTAPALPSIPTPDLSQVTLTPPKTLNGGDLGGFFAGLLLYTLGLNFLRHGPDGVKGWLRAKFLNEPFEAKGTVKGSKGGRNDNGNGLVSTRPTAPARV